MASSSYKKVTGVKPRRNRAGRPAENLITREKAAEAALAAIDEEGLERMSLQSVARRMGIAAPSLYYHFKDKDEILSEVALLLLNKAGEQATGKAVGWEDRIVELALATRRVALCHPNAASLTLRFFPRSLMLPAYERTLRQSPYPPHAHLVVLEVIEKFTHGAALFAAAAKARNIPAMPAVDAERLPNLARAIEEGADEEKIFTESIRVILDGLRARYADSDPGDA